MTKKLLIVFILLAFANKNTLADDTTKCNTKVSITVSEAFYKYSAFGYYEKKPRPYLELNAFPLNWLSIGAFYSPKNNKTEYITLLEQTCGGKISIHAYPIFELAGLDYWKNHFDIYLSGFIQRNYSIYKSKQTYNEETGTIIYLEEPLISKTSYSNSGIAFGLSYYIISNIGLNIEYDKAGNSFSGMSNIKLGLTFRL